MWPDQGFRHKVQLLVPRKNVIVIDESVLIGDGMEGVTKTE